MKIGSVFLIINHNNCIFWSISDHLLVKSSVAADTQATEDTPTVCILTKYARSFLYSVNCENHWLRLIHWLTSCSFFSKCLVTRNLFQNVTAGVLP